MPPIDSNYEDAIREAYTLAPTNVVHLETLEITHPLHSTSLFLVKDPSPHVLRLETGVDTEFEPVPFRMRLPSVSDMGVQELDVVIDNIDIDGRISDFLAAAKESSDPILLKYRPYLSTDKTKPQLATPLVLEMRGIKVTHYEIQGKASFANIVNRRFPNEFYDRARFPSLAGG